MHCFRSSITLLKPLTLVIYFLLSYFFSLALQVFIYPWTSNQFYLHPSSNDSYSFLFSSSKMVPLPFFLVASDSQFFANQKCNRSYNILEVFQTMNWNTFQYFIYPIHMLILCWITSLLSRNGMTAVLLLPVYYFN